MLLTDDSFVTSNTFGAGKGSDVRIETTDLDMREGAQISTTTFGPGNGGDVEVPAERMNLVGAFIGIFANAFGEIEGSGDALDRSPLPTEPTLLAGLAMGCGW